MKVISGGRGTGKTTKLLEEISKEYNKSTVVCRNPKHMYEKARYMNINNIQFITIDELLDLESAQYENIFFDDINDLLIDLFGAKKVKGYVVVL